MRLQHIMTDHPIGVIKGEPDFQKTQSLTLTADNNADAVLLGGLLQVLQNDKGPGGGTTTDHLTNLLGQCQGLFNEKS